jgi:hypothetical protein
MYSKVAQRSERFVKLPELRDRDDIPFIAGG